MFDALEDHVVITDAEGNVLYANPAVERHTGFPLGEVLGENPGDLWGGKMPKDFYENMWHTIKKEKKLFVSEVRNVRKDGTEYWQELYVAPVIGERGAVKFFLGIEPNITVRKRKEQFRKDFTSLIGNQVKDPLTSIDLTLKWLLANNNLTEKQQDLLKKMYAHKAALHSLVSDLLVLTRIEGLPKETSDKLKEVERLKEMQKIVNAFHQSSFHGRITIDESGRVNVFSREVIKPCAPGKGGVLSCVVQKYLYTRLFF